VVCRRAIVDELKEHAAARFRVNKCDAPTMGSPAWNSIDQLNSQVGEALHFTLQIAGSKGNVMHRIATLGQESGDGALRISRMDELDISRAGRKRDRFDPLLAHHKSLGAGESEQLILVERGVEVSNYDADVMQGEAAELLQHA
jgi:hypothetical protein